MGTGQAAMLKGKKVLLFAPHFFDYEKEIVQKLEEMGAEVTFYDERPGNSALVKACIRIDRRILAPLIDRYYCRILQETAAVKFDYVFVVNLEAMSPGIIKKFRKYQPQANFILYMWDSIENKRNTTEALSCFDHTFTFDSEDAAKISNLLLRPLFFTDAYDSSRWEPAPHGDEIDLFFLGTMHSDRYGILQKIRQMANSHHLKVYYYKYFPSIFLYLFRKLTERQYAKATYREFSFRELPRHEIVPFLKRSRIIIDIQHPGQAGLTIRTIEMLGAQKKIITTNDHILEYDFYNPENILLVDREKLEIPDEFFHTAYIPVDDRIRDKYSIGGWLAEIFSISDPALATPPAPAQKLKPHAPSQQRFA